MAHGLAGLRPVPFGQDRSDRRCRLASTGLAQPFLAIGGALGHGVQVAGNPGQPFVELRYVSVHHVDLFLDHIINRNGDIGVEWVWPLETVLEVHEDGVLPKRWRVRRDVRHDNHICRVLNEYTRVTMVGVIVVGPRREHEIGIPQPNLPNDLLAHVERGDQLAVVIIEHDVLDADAAPGFLCLGSSPRSEGASAFRLMSCITVGHRHEPDAMPKRGELRGRTAGALVAVIRMGAKRDDVQLAIGRRRLGALGRLPGGSRDADLARAHAEQRSRDDGQRDNCSLRNLRHYLLHNLHYTSA